DGLQVLGRAGPKRAEQDGETALGVVDRQADPGLTQVESQDATRRSTHAGGVFVLHALSYRGAPAVVRRSRPALRGAPGTSLLRRKRWAACPQLPRRSSWPPSPAGRARSHLARS